MAIDTISLRSRRAMLAGGLGAIAASVAGAFGRPLPALAEGESIKVGGRYPTATSATIIENRSNNKNVFVARSLARGTGVTGHGLVGVSGTSTRAVARGLHTLPQEPIQRRQSIGVSSHRCRPGALRAERGTLRLWN